MSVVPPLWGWARQSFGYVPLSYGVQWSERSLCQGARAVAQGCKRKALFSQQLSGDFYTYGKSGTFSRGVGRFCRLQCRMAVQLASGTFSHSWCGWGSGHGFRLSVQSAQQQQSRTRLSVGGTCRRSQSFIRHKLSQIAHIIQVRGTTACNRNHVQPSVRTELLRNVYRQQRSQCVFYISGECPQL